MSFLHPELLRAAYRGDTPTALEIIRERRFDDYNFAQSLYYAARGGQLETFRAILDLRKNEGDWVKTANYAAQGGSIEIVRLVLERMNVPAEDAKRWLLGLRFDVSGKNGVFSAAYGGQPEMLRFLLAQGAYVDVPNLEGQTALFYAAWQQPPGVDYPEGGDVAVETLLEFGADSSHQDQEGDTALNRATLGTLRVLLAHGANPNVFNKQDMSPLRFALERGRPRTLATLLEYGASLDERDTQGFTTREWVQRQ